MTQGISPSAEYKSILKDGEWVRGRTTYYHIYRLCERFPLWLKSPDDYFCLPEEKQAELLVYQHVRYTEEIESLSVGRMF